MNAHLALVADRPDFSLSVAVILVMAAFFVALFMRRLRQEDRDRRQGPPRAR